MHLLNCSWLKLVFSIFFPLMGVLSFSQSQISHANTTDCQVIASVPTVINRSGVYCFNRDLAFRETSGAAIEIRRNNVVVDLNGFRLFGTPALGNETVGIKVANKQKVRITNGTIERFRFGIELDRGIANSVDSVSLDQNRQFGILQRLNGKSLQISNNKISRTGGSTSPEPIGSGGEIFAIAALIGTDRDTPAFGVSVEGNTVFDVRPAGDSDVHYGLAMLSENALLKDNFISGRDFTAAIILNGEKNNVQKNTVINEMTTGSGIRLQGSLNVYTDNVALNFSNAFTSGVDGGGNVKVP